MKGVRIGLAMLGVALVGVGAVQLIESDVSQLVPTLMWFVGVVVVHDAVLAPATLAIVAVAARLVPREARTAALVGFVVWGTITLAVANVLMGVGGQPDNDSLLNRPYVPWWITLSIVWWIAVAGIGQLAVMRRRTTRGTKDAS